MTIITQSPNWRYKISIKHLFEDETTPELITKICESLIAQLTLIKNKIENSDRIDEDDRVNFEDRLFDEISNFEHLRDLSNGTIKEDDWHNYSFDGDFEDEFNGYLSQLYDLGDERILLKNNISEKFLWIG